MQSLKIDSGEFCSKFHLSLIHFDVAKIQIRSHVTLHMQPAEIYCCLTISCDNTILILPVLWNVCLLHGCDIDSITRSWQVLCIMTHQIRTDFCCAHMKSHSKLIGKGRLLTSFKILTRNYTGYSFCCSASTFFLMHCKNPERDKDYAACSSLSQNRKYNSVQRQPFLCKNHVAVQT